MVSGHLQLGVSVLGWVAFLVGGTLIDTSADIQERSRAMWSPETWAAQFEGDSWKQEGSVRTRLVMGSSSHMVTWCPCLGTLPRPGHTRSCFSNSVILQCRCPFSKTLGVYTVILLWGCRSLSWCHKYLQNHRVCGSEGARDHSWNSYRALSCSGSLSNSAAFHATCKWVRAIFPNIDYVFSHACKALKMCLLICGEKYKMQLFLPVFGRMSMHAPDL